MPGQSELKREEIAGELEGDGHVLSFEISLMFGVKGPGLVLHGVEETW